VISIRGLNKSFGKTQVLRDLDLEVARGSIFALLGPNGAGKTTLINILSTLVEPDSGNASVAGFDVVRDRESVKRVISLTGQSAAVDEVLTAEENLLMMGRLSGLSRAAAVSRARELLVRFDLADTGKKRVKTFSGGMRRRLDLAISLLLTPPVIFLDEPTTGLDTRSRQDMWDLIASLAAAGTTIFLTTQYLEEADRLADQIAVLEHGVIVAQGSPAELKARVGGEVLAVHDERGDVLLEMPTDGTLAGLRDVLGEIRGRDADAVSLRTPSLDDVFLAVTGAARPIEELALTGKKA
jgi:ABC-2 type transport system ATP-binding protein